MIFIMFTVAALVVFALVVVKARKHPMRKDNLSLFSYIGE